MGTSAFKHALIMSRATVYKDAGIPVILVAIKDRLNQPIVVTKTSVLKSNHLGLVTIREDTKEGWADNLS